MYGIFLYYLIISRLIVAAMQGLYNTVFIRLQIAIVCSDWSGMARKRDSCRTCNIMTNKIYEYKDDQDWYVGVWDVYGGIYSLIKDPLDLDFMVGSQFFRDEENGFPITITVMRWSSTSVYSLLSLRF